MSPTDRGGPTSSAVGSLHLLPSELLHSILLRLPLPDLLRLRSLSRLLLSSISAPEFRRTYQSTSPWLFLFQKRPPRSSLLRGFDPRSARWFTFPSLSALIAAPALPPGDDLYLLAAAPPAIFLLASNGLRQLIAVDLISNTVKKIPHSPLGPRGTSSWRRSGLKLVVSQGQGPGPSFQFLFAELLENRPVLFDYQSTTDTWRSIQVEGGVSRPPRGGVRLSVAQSGHESVVLCTDGPVVCRPRFRRAGHLDTDYRLHVYGDGYMAVVRSAGSGARTKVVREVEVWGLSSDGREWELVGGVGAESMGSGVGRPYGVMMGCLEEREGVIRLVLVSNCRGIWGLMWLNYDRSKGEWEWVPVPDCGTEGLNMAGIAISSSFLGFQL